MTLTKDKLREIGTSEGLIDLLLGRWPDGVPTTAEALIQANDMGLDLCRVGGLIDWDRWSISQGIVSAAHHDYQEASEKARAKIDAAHRRYQETHAEVLARCLEYTPERRWRAAEVIDAAMQVINYFRDAVADDRDRSAYPYAWRIDAACLLEDLKEAAERIESYRDLMEENNSE